MTISFRAAWDKAEDYLISQVMSGEERSIDHFELYSIRGESLFTYLVTYPRSCVFGVRKTLLAHLIINPITAALFIINTLLSVVCNGVKSVKDMDWATVCLATFPILPGVGTFLAHLALKLICLYEIYHDPDLAARKITRPKIMKGGKQVH